VPDVTYSAELKNRCPERHQRLHRTRPSSLGYGEPAKAMIDTIRVLALDFARDVSAMLAGAIAAVTILASLIHLLASLSLTVFLFVFYKSQS
jgi:hypothetical protein